MASSRRRRPRKFEHLLSGNASHEYAYARHMAMRALSPVGAFRKAFADTLRALERGDTDIYHREEELLDWLDLFDDREAAVASLTATKLRAALVAQCRAADRQPPVTACRRNVDWLGALVRLEPVECDLLELLLTVRQNDMLANALDRAGDKNMRADGELLGRLIGAPANDVVRALGKHGNLVKYGFIRFDHGYENFLARVEMSSDTLGKLVQPCATQAEFVQSFLNPAEPVSLTAEDMPHLAAHLQTLERVLPNAIAGKVRGINILLHGEPGTGKTQFASLVAQAAGLQAYRVIKPDDDDPQSGNERLGYYAIVQQMLRGRGGDVLVFDEFEDVVPDNDPFMGLFAGKSRRSAPMKSWLTQILEDNPVPTIWISNEIGHIDCALLRRFTYTIEFRTPPASVRRRILTQAVAGLDVRPQWIERMAHVGNLSPALVRNAAKIATLADARGEAANEALLDRTIAGSMNAMGQRATATGLSPATRYDLSFVNATPGPDRIAAALALVGRGTLCFYGPPGTGKTAFAGYLAKQLDRPLLIKRASDLLSMWVGGSEKNIARAFREADDENAVLLIDEADSFLADRAGAQRSWEVTQVNEMLQQIEHFQGVLICTTNRIDHMDPAVLRRFSHKVGFAYLQPAQRTAMFFSEFGNVFAEAEHRGIVEHALAPLANLAPGDFATLRRQFDAGGQAMALHDVLAVLAAECDIKPDRQHRGMGFL